MGNKLQFTPGHLDKCHLHQGSKLSFFFQGAELHFQKLLNPSNAEATFVQSTRMQISSKTSKPCHICIHWKALAEHFHKSTHLLAFHPFIRFFA